MTDAINTDNLTKIYHMGDVDVEALTDVSITVKEGEFVSIMGPSGSGKSTLMHLLGLLDTPTRGSVYISGEDTSQFSDRQKALFRLSRIGFVFQFYSLLSGFTALENAYLPLLLNHTPQREAEQQARDALETVGLGDRLGHTPSELSGGQRQRVAIARAIVNDPDIILADEPASQLDTKTSRQIMDVFRSLAEEGRTVITVNHEEELGRLSDRVIWLEDGVIQPYDG